MPRGEQIQRHWRVLQLLQRRGVGLTLRELTEELEVGERTVQRDFELLQELGFPLEFETDEIGRRYWRIPHDFFKTAPLTLSLTEAISIHLAEHVFAPLAATQFGEGLHSVLGKIRSQISAKALDYFRGLDETIYVRQFGWTDHAAHAETIALLTRAVRECCSVEISYKSVWRDDSYATKVDPYGIVFYESELFVVGYSHRAGATRVFKIVRMLDAALVQENFQRPAEFDLAAHFRSTFGIVRSGSEPQEVVVRFRGPGATLVEERIWHESQKLEWLPTEATLFEEAPEQDGHLLVTFRLSNTVEFKRWLKGFGTLAEVVRPDWLRAEIHQELLEAATIYQA
jgi:predicted DNA-binding transcriptional regulator YafY